MVRMVKIREHERGLLFEDREFLRVLGPGRHWLVGAPWRFRVDVVSVRDVWLEHAELDVIVRSGALAHEAIVVDLADARRALVWIDDRFAAVLGPGLYALWTAGGEAALRRRRAVVTEVTAARSRRMSGARYPNCRIDNNSTTTTSNR